ncbi:MAG: hypothetical protein H7833_21215, partial [Magnetococcus sp. DMHC-1]
MTLKIFWVLLIFIIAKKIQNYFIFKNQRCLSIIELRQNAGNILDRLFQERHLLHDMNPRSAYFLRSIGNHFDFSEKTRLISREFFYDQWPRHHSAWPAHADKPPGWETEDPALVDILYWIHAQVSPIAKGDPDILV